MSNFDGTSFATHVTVDVKIVICGKCFKILSLGIIVYFCKFVE
jgi:hypothetical protein